MYPHLPQPPPTILIPHSKTFAEKKKALKEVLEREYTTLFDPFERQFYTPDVSFTDPMTSFTGMDKYQGSQCPPRGRGVELRRV